MGSRRLLSLSDALVLLGADPPRLAALDRSLGGVLAVATGGVSDGLLRIADARGRILGLGRDAVRGVGARLGAADGRVERGELLRAAHTVVVVLGWFEALTEQDLPFSLDAVRITRGDQLSLVGAGETDAGFARALAAVDAPFPLRTSRRRTRRGNSSTGTRLCPGASCGSWRASRCGTRSHRRGGTRRSGP